MSAPPASFEANYTSVQKLHLLLDSTKSYIYFFPLFFFPAAVDLVALGGGSSSLLLAMKLNSGRGPGAT